MKFFNHLEFFPFLMGLMIGLFIVYILKPAPYVITKYPNLENTESVVYKDRAGTCFKYEVKTIDCDKAEERLKPYPLQ